MFKAVCRVTATIVFTFGIAAVVSMADGIIGSPANAIPEVPTDKDIVQAVETELLIDDGVESHLIDVASENGVVTLTGSVDNLMAKRRAAQVAQTVKGVKSVVNTIEVRMVVRPDHVIRTDVVEGLAVDPATDSYEVDVEVENGIVTLKGEVDSWQESTLAEKVARSVKGVRAVENQLTFEFTAERPDPEIVADIRGALEWDARVNDELIEVQVSEGEVTLEGTVGSLREKNQAYAKAWVAGVKGVENQLEVLGWRSEMTRGYNCAERSDEDTERAIRDALMRDPRVTFFHPEVEVDNNVVTLSGVVDNLKAKKAAEQDAKNTICVWRVKNFLKVRPAQLVSDDTIEERVETALSVEPFVNRYDIGVSVLNGKVSLYGEVDSFFQSRQAEDAASRVNGVVEVENHLTVRDLWTLREDREIKEDIEDQLWWSPFVDSDTITVSVDDGTATLTGFVDSWQEYSAATENAYEGGAKEVRNRLKVRGGLS